MDGCTKRYMRLSTHCLDTHDTHVQAAHLAMVWKMEAGKTADRVGPRIIKCLPQEIRRTDENFERARTPSSASPLFNFFSHCTTRLLARRIGNARMTWQKGGQLMALRTVFSLFFRTDKKIPGFKSEREREQKERSRRFNSCSLSLSLSLQFITRLPLYTVPASQPGFFILSSLLWPSGTESESKTSRVFFLCL